MRYMNIRRVIAVAVLLTIVAVVGLGQADHSPTNEEREAAKKTSDLLHNELFSALITEFNETTAENAEQGKHAISLIFNDSNRDLRLIGVFEPLQGGFNDVPSDQFEQRSLSLALQGKGNTSFERMGSRWYYRRSDPLSNTFHPNCVLCHTNFANLQNEGQWVGALVTRVPIERD
jgi:hypothetical protein